MTATTDTVPAAMKDALPGEVVTHALVRDIALPSGAGTLALITLDNGHDHTKPNTFGPAGLSELATAVATLAERARAGEIAAVGITGKPYIFAVGADLTGVPAVTDRSQAVEVARAGHAVFGAVADLPVPTFAFINGAAMGGGVELSLCCDYRTISASVPAVALPECFLGLVPGWGGCYLLPRLIGPEKALKVIIENALSQNTMLKGPQAYALGMADAMFPAVDFLEDSLAFAAGVVSGSVTVEREPVSTDEEDWSDAANAARMVAFARTGGAAVAPMRAIDLVEAARTATREEGFAAEDEALGDLVMGDQLRAGLYAFDLVQRRAKRPAGAPDKALARPVTAVGIVGAGLMASQLALLFAERLGVPVAMTDLDEARVTKGVGYVHAEIDKKLAKGRISSDRASFLRRLVSGSTDPAVFADADFVIEAVFEEMSVKKQVWAQVESVVSDHCVLASNTSSLSITEMAADLKHPERVVGFHFFNPVAVMPLLEIIPGERTDDVALATAFAVGKDLRKTTIRVKDSASFIVNRLLGRFLGEFARIIDNGTPEDVATEAVLGLAPMPPFMLLQLVGLPIALHNSESLERAFGDRFYVSPALKAAVAAGSDDLDAYRTEATDPVELEVAQVRSRVLDAMADEVGRMLQEGVAQAPMDIDLAMITGAGFQFWNGGLIPLLDREGASERVVGRRFLPPGAASAIPA